MSTTFTSGLMASIKKGKQIIQNVLKTKTQKVVKVTKPQTSLQTCKISDQPLRYQNRLQQIWRAITPRLYYNSLAAQLGRQAAWRAGRNAPLLAFVGLAFSQNADKDENEIASRIKDFLKIASPCEQPMFEGVSHFSLDNFDFGCRIGQGCNAAVYEARWKDPCQKEESDTSNEETVLSNNESEFTEQNKFGSSHINQPVVDKREPDDCHMEERTRDDRSEVPDTSCQGNRCLVTDDDDISDNDSDITVISWKSDEDYLLEEGAPLMFTTDKEVHVDDSDSEFSVIMSDASEDDFDVLSDEDQRDGAVESIDDEVKTKTEMSTSRMMQWFHQQQECNQVYQQEEETGEMYQSLDSSILLDDGRTRPKLKYDLAVKMMFNYDIESNATVILKCMEKETVPAQISTMESQEELLRNRNKDRNKSLPPHPNIVAMWGVFVDPVPSLPDGLINYPAALPNRINPDGMGRNMTMFIVMKRYDMTLTEYLSMFNLTFRERIYLLAQLLEAVDHLYKHGIAHRDMKTDNILLDTTRDGPAHLVLSDFGCCLADPKCGLMLPYPTDEIDKGGNTALMAPEISCAEPGPYAKLDYRKADLWGVGAIAYEILGANNPFYSSNRGKLDSRTYYDTELPSLTKDIPQAIQRAVQALLSRDPKKRPSARQVLDILYAYLWCPSEWLDTEVKVEVTKQEVTWWIITMTTDLHLKQRSLMDNTVDMMLMALFIKNVKFRQFCSVLNEYNTYVI